MFNPDCISNSVFCLRNTCETNHTRAWRQVYGSFLDKATALLESFFHGETLQRKPPFAESYRTSQHIYTEKSSIYHHIPIVVGSHCCWFSLLTTIFSNLSTLPPPKKNSHPPGFAKGMLCPGSFVREVGVRREHMGQHLVHKGLTNPALGARQWTVVKCPVLVLFCFFWT